MKKLTSAFFLILFSAALFAQDLSGIWVGELPQFDDELPYTYELELVQEGNTLTGTSKIINPQNINYAIMELKGEIKGDKIVLIEQDVLESWLTPAKIGGWRLKELHGELGIDEETGVQFFSGRWFSERLWLDRKGNIVPSALARPGRFELWQLDPAEANVEEDHN